MKNHFCSLPCFSVSNKKSPQQIQGSQLPEGLYRHFSLAQIKAATNNFVDSIIGRGYGPVYKGTTNDGNTVAVKRWQIENGSYGARKLQNEVVFLCQLSHPQFVSLFGICEEGNERILVYEYTSRGALSDHLYGEGYAPLLWKQRLQICIGAARGLHYLHTGAKYALFHGPITSRSILLNEEFSCNLADFGSSKLGSFCMSKASKVLKESRVTGTSCALGCMASEYAVHGELIEKTDVFSFGIVLFEVLFSRAAYDRTLPQNQSYILDWIKKYLREGTIYHAIDPRLEKLFHEPCPSRHP